MAAEKGVDASEVFEAVEHCGGPALNATTADAVRRSISYGAVAAVGNN